MSKRVLVLSAEVKTAFEEAGEMCVAMDEWMRAMAEGEPARSGAYFAQMLEARRRYDRAMVALTEARNAGS